MPSAGGQTSEFTTSAMSKRHHVKAENRVNGTTGGNVIVLTQLNQTPEVAVCNMHESLQPEWPKCLPSTAPAEAFHEPRVENTTICQSVDNVMPKLLERRCRKCQQQNTVQSHVARIVRMRYHAHITEIITVHQGVNAPKNQQFRETAVSLPRTRIAAASRCDCCAFIAERPTANLLNYASQTVRANRCHANRHGLMSTHNQSSSNQELLALNANNDTATAKHYGGLITRDMPRQQACQPPSCAMERRCRVNITRAFMLNGADVARARIGR